MTEYEFPDFTAMTRGEVSDYLSQLSEALDRDTKYTIDYWER